MVEALQPAIDLRGAEQVTYLNRGMYDVVEAAHLVGVSPDTVLRWAHEAGRRPALLRPSLGGLYSFHDLIGLLVIARLRARRVKMSQIAEGVQTLTRQFGTDKPLAHMALRDLATAGRSFLARVRDEGARCRHGRAGAPRGGRVARAPAHRVRTG